MMTRHQGQTGTLKSFYNALRHPESCPMTPALRRHQNASCWVFAVVFALMLVSPGRSFGRHGPGGANDLLNCPVEWTCPTTAVISYGKLSTNYDMICVGGSPVIPERVVDPEFGKKSKQCTDSAGTNVLVEFEIYSARYRWGPPLWAPVGTIDVAGTNKYRYEFGGTNNDHYCPDPEDNDGLPRDTGWQLLGEKTYDVKVVEVASLEPDPEVSTYVDTIMTGSGNNIPTKVYVVPWVEPVPGTPGPYVWVEAEGYPGTDLEEVVEYLKGCWTLCTNPDSGSPECVPKDDNVDGVVDGVDDNTGETYLKLRIDRTVPSSTLVRCEAGTSQKRVLVHVVKVDLDIWNGGGDLDNGEAAGSQGAQVAEDDEEAVGAYLLVNWDDDDGDGEINGAGSGWSSLPKPDLDESTAITDEDNLAQLKPSLEPMLDIGTVELEVSGADTDKIKLWEKKTKETEVSTTTWDLSNSTQKSEFEDFIANSLWIEGIAEGTAERAVTFTLRYKTSGATEICNDVNKATVVMVNLANVVGREVDRDALAERGHTSIVGRYDGPCTRVDILNAAQYTLYESDGGGDWIGTEPGPREAALTNVTAKPGREFFGSLSPFLTSYYNSQSMANTVVGYRNRLMVLLVARRLIDNTASIGYTKFNAVSPGSWNGNLSTVTATRCDGFVEVCYEWSGVNSWGRIVGGTAQYSMLIAGNQDDHNEWAWGDDPQHGASDFWAWLMPITQIGYADTYIDSHYPLYTSGAFDYTAGDFEGTFWESAFSAQQLVKPTLSTP